MPDMDQVAMLPKRTQDALLGSVLTPKEVANILKLSERTVVYHFKMGNIPAKKIGMSWRCKRSELEKYLSSAA